MSAFDFTARALAMRATALTPLTHAELQQAQVPESVTRIASSGHSEAGSGAAVYVADSLADAALQAAHPTAVFQDGRGRYFRLASEEQGFVRPEQLGWTEGESHSGRIFTEAFEYQAAVAGRRGDAASGVVELTAGRTYRLGDLASRPHGGVTFTGRSFLQPGNRLRGNGATLQGSHALGGSLAMAYSEVLSIHPVVGPMAAGERTFQLETPDDAQAYAVGDWVKWRLGDVSYDPPETFNSGWARVQQVDTASGEITLDRHIRLDWDGTGTINRHLRRLRPLTGTVYEDLVLRAPTESSHDNLVYGVRIYDGYGVKLDNITGFNCGAGTIVLQYCEAFHVGSVAGHANPRLDHGSYGRGISLCESRGRIDSLVVSDCGRFGAYCEFATDVTIGYFHDVVVNDTEVVGIKHRGIYAGTRSRVHIERALFEGKGGFYTHESARVTEGKVTFGECRIVADTLPFVMPAPGYDCDRLELVLNGVEETYSADKAQEIEIIVPLHDGMTSHTADFAPGIVIEATATFGGGAVAADFTSFHVGRPSARTSLLAELVPAVPTDEEVNLITAYTYGPYVADTVHAQAGTGSNNGVHRAEAAQVVLSTVPAGLTGSGKYVRIRMKIVRDEQASALAAMPSFPDKVAAALAVQGVEVAGLASLAAAPTALFRSAIPFIIPSSGSIGDDGALTVATALPATYPQAFVWLGQGVVDGANGAGWYYAQFASPTAATVFDETYVGGTPAVPVNPAAFVSAGPGAYTQDVSGGRQGPAFVLPANTMGANGKLRFEGSLRMSQNANVKSISVRLGTTALPAAASLINSAGVSFTGRLKGREAVDAQHAELWTSGGNSLSVAPGLVGVDMTQPQSLNAALFMAVASDFLVLTDFEVIQEA